MTTDSTTDEEQARLNLMASYDGRRQHDWGFSAARANAHATLALIREQRTTNEILVLILRALENRPTTETLADGVEPIETPTS